jgi:hypothetical protein
MTPIRSVRVVLLCLSVCLALLLVTSIQAQTKKPNIVFIMGDDIGWFNIGVYNQGMMAGRTPNLDRLAAEGMRFTDYYAEASCTAGRANFITGELPFRTGMTTVGQAGAKIGMPDEAPTIATALKTMGYATGQFGKNHLGDLNPYLPTLHGFDEFWGYLYHLDAMEDPFHYNYPQSLKDKVGPRNLLHTWATNTDDPTVDPRWGKVGRQKIEDEGPLPPHPISGIKYNMETVDDVILDHALQFIDKSKTDGKPFFVWLNPTRMHVVTHLSEKYEICARRKTDGQSRKREWSSSTTSLARSCRSSKTRASTTTQSSCSPPTTGPRISLGPMVVRRRLQAVKELSSKAVSEFRALFAGLATYRRARWRTESSPVLTGSQRLSRRLEIQILWMS